MKHPRVAAAIALGILFVSGCADGDPVKEKANSAPTHQEVESQEAETATEGAEQEPQPTISTEGEISAIHAGEGSLGSKADAAIFLAYKDGKANLDEPEVDAEAEAQPYVDDIIERVLNEEIITNTDKEFLLNQVYAGALVDAVYGEGTTEQTIGFDYMQVARDLYRETTTAEEAFVQSNMKQLHDSIAELQ